MWKKILKWVLIFLFVVLLLLASVALVFLLNWPLWTVVLVILGEAALILIFYFLYRLWAKRKEDRFVEEIAGEEISPVSEAPPEERDRLKEIQERWKEAVDALRKSHLKKYGNPLYVLPWYMVIGESATGKTTAIRNANLSSPFTETSRTQGVSGTRNCDWWFFDHAIILDTAGRYAIPLEESKDREEWFRFLSLLAKYRKKEPINGLIVTVSVENLQTKNFDELRRDGFQLRQRIDELMKKLGVRFPVYVLITKADLVEGMMPFFEQLPESCLNQALGKINRDPDGKSSTVFFDEAFAELVGEIKDIRLELAKDMPPEVAAKGALLFPEELERLYGPLHIFLGALFQETPYQEQPLFRGFYFTSGRQEGQPFSHFLSALGLGERSESLPAGNKSCFLHDFFTKILLKDRELLTPTRRALYWRRLTQNIGLATWILIALLAIGVLTFSFVQNMGTIRTAAREIPTKLKVSNDIPTNIKELDKYRQVLVRLHKRNSSWWIPRMGLRQSLVLERKLATQYVKLFQEKILWPLDDNYGRQLALVTAETPHPLIASNVDLLTRRLYLIKARMNGSHFKELSSMKQPDYVFYLKTSLSAENPENLAAPAKRTYLTYLSYQGEDRYLKKEFQELNEWLKKLLKTRGIGLFWLTSWANLQKETLKPVTYTFFWGGDEKLENEIGPHIARAYTPEGYAAITSFINEIADVYEDPQGLEAHKKAYFKVYKSEYLKAWEGFVKAFPDGYKLWPERVGQREIASRFGSNSSPYRKLFKVLPVELVPARGGTEPGWIEELDSYLRLGNPEYQRLLKTGRKGFRAFMMKGGSKFYKWVKRELQGQEAAKVYDRDKLAYNFITRYKSGINTFAHQILSPKSCFESASKAFEEGYSKLVAPKHPILSAEWNYEKYKNIMTNGSSDEEAFWGLLEGQIKFLWHFCVQETAYYLQELWEKDVLSEVEGLPSNRAMEILLGQQGKLWSFLSGPAAPFVERKGRRGYRLKVVMGESVPLNTSFLNFAKRGKVGRGVVTGTHTVHIATLPTDANVGARLKPHETKLVLKCSSGTQTLINYNYPRSADFEWNPESCDEVILQIMVGDVVLTKRYQGVEAFPSFLRDFRYGKKTFRRRDFPKQASKLAEYGIKTITVKYKLRGHLPIINVLGVAPRRVPKQIISVESQQGKSGK